MMLRYLFACIFLMTCVLFSPLNSNSITETPTGTPTESPTFTPTHLPTNTPTPFPTFTPTATPGPAFPDFIHDHYRFEPLIWEDSRTNYPYYYPPTQEWLTVETESYFTEFEYQIEILAYENFTDAVREIKDQSRILFEFKVESNTPWSASSDIMTIDKQDNIYIKTIAYHNNPYRLLVIDPEGKVTEVELPKLYRSLNRPYNPVVVPENHQIPGANAGDLIITIFNQIYILHKSDWSLEELQLTSPNGYQEIPMDRYTIKDGVLFIISKIFTREPVKIFWVDQEGILHEWLHENLPIRPMDFTYFEADQSFLYMTYETLYRIGEKNKEIEVIATNINDYQLISSDTGEQLWLRASHTFGELKPYIPDDPTPTPTEVPCTTLTPEPPKGWFIVDGFGGIHSSNPELEKPVLPYFAPFNIVRDIEPDPIYGWYMLDGYGGIHSDPNDLPKPENLPYFGFDIARSLEIRYINGKRHFYLLDGFGAIHTTDPDFEFGNLPFFGGDYARDLEHRTLYRNCFYYKDEWLVMDVYGNIFLDTALRQDTLRFAHPVLISPIMKSFVRFEDDTTLMLDYAGGRHTNPFYPAEDMAEGFPPDFYFPGWDILWDIEPVY